MGVLQQKKYVNDATLGFSLKEKTRPNAAALWTKKPHQMITDTDPVLSLLTWSELNIKLNWMITVTSVLHEHPLFVKGTGLMVSITIHFVNGFNSFNGYTCFLFRYRSRRYNIQHIVASLNIIIDVPSFHSIPIKPQCYHQMTIRHHQIPV